MKRSTGPPMLVIGQNIARTIFDSRTEDNGKIAGSSDVTIAVDFQGS